MLSIDPLSHLIHPIHRVGWVEVHRVRPDNYQSIYSSVSNQTSTHDPLTCLSDSLSCPLDDQRYPSNSLIDKCQTETPAGKLMIIKNDMSCLLTELPLWPSWQCWRRDKRPRLSLYSYSTSGTHLPGEHTLGETRRSQTLSNSPVCISPEAEIL